MRSRSTAPADSPIAANLQGWAAALLAPLLIAACARPVELNLANASASHVDLAAWVDGVEADADGAIAIRINGRDTTLGASLPRQLAQLRDGVADLAVLSTGYLPGDFPDDVSEVPSLFADAEEGSVVVWRLVEQGVLRGYADLHVIGVWTGADRWLHTRFPVPELTALAGRRIGVPSDFAVPIVEALGARPVAISAAGAADAISADRLDGIFVGLRGLYEQRIIDAARFHPAAPLGRPLLAVVMTRARFEALPPAARAALALNSGEAISRAWGADEQFAHNARAAVLRAASDQTVRTLTPEETTQWQEAAQAGIDAWIAADPVRQRALDAARREITTVRTGG